MGLKKGFTLIELLIVVAIIGILAAIAVPNFLNAQMRSKIARVEGDFQSIATAFEMYRLDNGDLPRWNLLGWAQSWARFTTPIAYLGIRPIDPFEAKFENEFQHSHNWYEYSACKGRTPMKNLEEGEVVDNWVLAAYGPNGIDHTQQISDYPNTQKFLKFDISNGIRSNGDIYKESSPGLNPQQWN